MADAAGDAVRDLLLAGTILLVSSALGHVGFSTGAADAPSLARQGRLWSR